MTAIAPTVHEGGRATLDRTLLRELLRANRFLGDERAHQFYREVEVAGAHAGSYEIRIATRPDQFLEAFRLRYVSYASNGYLNPAYDFPLDLEYDAHDAHAALFLARNVETGAVHGGARLVIEADGRLPIDSYYSLDPLRARLAGADDRPVLAEFSRLISHPVGQRELNKALVRAVFGFAAEHAVDYIVGAGRVDIRHYYDKWGFRDVEPGLEFDFKDTPSPITPPMRVYPHYMHVSDVRWEHI